MRKNISRDPQTSALEELRFYVAMRRQLRLKLINKLH